VALVQHITYGLNSVVSIEPSTRPSNALISVYDNEGSAIVNNTTATVSTANTVTIAAVNARAKTISVSNANAITEGMRLRLSSPAEWVRVKTVSGNSVSLWGPLREAHANGVAVESTKCTYTIGANNITSTFFDGRCRWELSGNAIAYTGVECTLYPLARTATEIDLAEVNSQFAQMLAAEEDPEAALDAAHEYVLEQLGKRGRARTYPASPEFNRCVALAFARNHYLGQSTEAAAREFEKFSKECGEAIATIMANLIPDEDQDGEIEADEQKSANSILVERG